MQIRAEKPEDIEAIHQVNAIAFGREGEADLVDRLRGTADTFSFVAIESGQIVGHLFFSPVTIKGNSGAAAIAADLLLLGLAPVAVLPNYQHQGTGSRLIRFGLDACKKAGCSVIVVLGAPGYYGRFGFAPACEQGLRCEYSVPDDLFRVLELKAAALNGLTGTVKYHPEFSKLE